MTNTKIDKALLEISIVVDVANKEPVFDVIVYGYCLQYVIGILSNDSKSRLNWTGHEGWW